MPLVKQHRNPSTLIDILKQCKGALDAMGTFMPTSIGKAFLSEGTGSAPRVVFVPESGPGRIGPPREMGMAASVTHTCKLYVRGRESGDDTTRFEETYALADLVIDLVATAAPGRIEWVSYTDGSPTDTNAYGAEVVGAFTYRRDVAHSAARWGLPQALSDLTALQAQPPPGDPAGGLTVEPTTVPVAPGG
jgi:hypothetical protein